MKFCTIIRSDAVLWVGPASSMHHPRIIILMTLSARCVWKGQNLLCYHHRIQFLHIYKSTFLLNSSISMGRGGFCELSFPARVQIVVSVQWHHCGRPTCEPNRPHSLWQPSHMLNTISLTIYIQHIEGQKIDYRRFHNIVNREKLWTLDGRP